MKLRDDRCDAVISDDGDYRYSLRRMWNTQKPTIAFIMLNPSTADAEIDDPTIRRCIDYAKQWGYGTLIVGNLFALRSANPNNLLEHPEPIGVENNRYLREISDISERVIAAWGTNGALHGRDQAVAQLLRRDFYALNTTKNGYPAHPLYQPSDANPTRYQIAEEIPFE